MGILEDLAAVPSYFQANAKPGDPLSYEALQTRRKIAEQLMGKRSPFPKTFGEGLTYAGERIADVMNMNRLDAAEKQQAAYEANVLRGGPPLPGRENTAVAPAGQPASRPVSDAGTDTTAPVQTAAAPGQPLDVTPSRFANVRYNNPGAQYPVSGENATAFGQQGAGTIGGGHKIAQFPTPVHGAAANMDLLDRNYTGTTIGDAINKWSGGGRRNVPGFNTDTVITKEMMRDPSFAIPFMQAVAGGEAPGRYPMNEDQWAQAHNMFTGVRGGTPPPLPPSDPRGRITQAVVDQAEPDSAPVRTAALTTPGVASDAGPASAIADGASTAIAALPTQQTPPTQTPPLIPGDSPNPTTIPLAPPAVRTPGVQTAQAPTLGPSQEPIPPASLPDIPARKEVPPRPKPLGPGREEIHWQGVMNNPGISDRGRAYAAQQLGAWQENRKELDKQQQEDFTHERGTAEAHNLLVDKIIRELPKDQQEELVRRLNIEKMQATNPFEARQAEANLNNTLATIEKIRQEIAAGKAPEHIKFENGKVGQWDQKTGTYKDITPQINPLDIQLKEGEGKKLEFYVRARGASDQLGNDAKSLTNLGSALATRTRSVFGNYAVSPQYQKEYALAKMWGMAVLRDESGAALPEKEIESKMTTYWPVPNDTPETIAAKAQARRREETSFYLSLGGARPLADFYVERQTTQPEGTVLKDQTGKVRRTVKNGLWMDVPDGR